MMFSRPFRPAKPDTKERQGSSTRRLSSVWESQKDIHKLQSRWVFDSRKGIVES
jgi:hypothetical protein